jgi:hypothetical protein
MPEGGELRFIGDARARTSASSPRSTSTSGASGEEGRGHPRCAARASRDIVTVELEGANIRVASVVDDALPNESSYTHDTKLSDLVDVVVADFDDDGDGDIAVVNGACTVRVLINQTVVK